MLNHDELDLLFILLSESEDSLKDEIDWTYSNEDHPEHIEEREEYINRLRTIEGLYSKLDLIRKGIKS